MEVLANQEILTHFSRNIDIFKLDLGFNLTGEVKDVDKRNFSSKKDFKIVIKDPFIKKYQTLTNRIIYSHGSIGTLKFYIEPYLLKDELVIFNNDDIYEINMDMNEFYDNPRKLLSDVIENIVNVNKKNESDDNNNEENYSEFKGKTLINGINFDDDNVPDNTIEDKSLYVKKMVEYYHKNNSVQFDEDLSNKLNKKRNIELYGNR